MGQTGTLGVKKLNFLARHPVISIQLQYSYNTSTLISLGFSSTYGGLPPLSSLSPLSPSSPSSPLSPLSPLSPSSPSPLSPLSRRFLRESGNEIKTETYLLADKLLRKNERRKERKIKKET